MILIGIDDTDIVGSRGTNQLAREIVRTVASNWRCLWIVRHQLLDDPRVPYTSQNGSASIALEYRESAGSSIASSENDLTQETTELLNTCREVMRSWFIEGSDPGLCLLTGECPQTVIDWGLRCQRELVSRDQAVSIASQNGVHLESLGGTEDGMIGALAAVGLASQRNDGRIVQWGEWPDDLSYEQGIEVLTQRNVWVCDQESGDEITSGTVNVGKHLRPNLRSGAAVLTVKPGTPPVADVYQALKLR